MANTFFSASSGGGTPAPVSGPLTAFTVDVDFIQTDTPSEVSAKWSFTYTITLNNGEPTVNAVISDHPGVIETPTVNIVKATPLGGNGNLDLTTHVLTTATHSISYPSSHFNAKAVFIVKDGEIIESCINEVTPVS